MKLSTKPMSSPGRMDKFPPPLMRFLRSNGGSRSRGRSRSSPMFVRKKNIAIETQEPSSPKVTCMGQVRVRRSSKQGAAKRARPVKDGAPTRCHCRWIRNALLCSANIKPKPCQPVWPKWGFFRLGSFRRKPAKVREDSSRTESIFRHRFHNESEHEADELEDEEEEEYEERVHVDNFVTTSSTPPKNALLLTRCRSAPYRSSSLASRFWGSPLKNEEDTVEKLRTEEENTQEKSGSERESISDQDDKMDAKTEEKLGLFKHHGDSTEERVMNSENVQELKRNDEGEDSGRPLVLTRSKSEPARTGQKLDPELNFWKKMRLGFADSCSPHGL